MVSNFSPYYLGAAFMVVIGVFMAITGRYMWALPFFGGALVLFFLGKGQDMDSSGGGDAR